MTKIGEFMRIISLIFILYIFSCSSKKDNDTVAMKSSEAIQYEYKADSTMIQFTAYKFTEKVAVSGVFNTIMINKTKQSDNPFHVFSDSEFEILTSSLNTTNPARDQTILKYFFNEMKDNSAITGKVLAISKEGKGKFLVALNGHAKEVEFECRFDGTNIHFNSEIDLEDFQGHDAIDSLNEACKANHIGTDGVIKLWPNIKLYLKVNVR